MEKKRVNNEQLLVKSLREGEETAFRKLFNAYHQDIYAFSISLLKSKTQAEEVVQDVFLKVWLNRAKLDPELSFKSYIFTIGRNLAFNFLAKAANDLKLREKIFYKSQVKTHATDRKLVEADYDELKRQALEELSPRCKLVFQMSREEGKTYEDISQELGVSVNTVKNQMSTSLATIKKFLVVNGDIVFMLAFLLDVYS